MTVNLEELKKDYLDGLTYNELQNKYGITYSNLKSILQKHKWKRKSNRSKVQKGNKSSKGHKPSVPKNNKNGVVTGGYESIHSEFYTEKEKIIAQKLKNIDEIEALEQQYEVLVVRERRMLERIDSLNKANKDLTIQSITRTKVHANDIAAIPDSSVTHAELTLDKIQRIEEALTKVSDAQRRCVESINKIRMEQEKFDLELLRFEREVSKDNEEEHNQATDNTLIEVLKASATEVWKDET